MIYLYSCVAAKLIHSEAESAAIAIFLAERIGVPLISSAIPCCGHWTPSI
jgi:hypothetical protein